MNKSESSLSASSMRTAGNIPLRWMIAILLLALFLLAGVAVFVAEVRPESFQVWIENLGMNRSSIGAQITFFLIALVLVSLVLPKTVVSLSAGALFGTITGGVLIALISVVAAVLNYAIGRWWIRGLIWESKWIRGGEIGQHKPPTWILAIRGMSAEAGYLPHLMLRFASIPSMLLNYFMGAVGARVAPFMTAAVIGILPQLLWVHSGAIASIDSDNVSAGRWVSTLLSLCAALVVTVILPREVMKRIRDQACESEKNLGYTVDDLIASEVNPINEEPTA